MFTEVTVASFRGVRQMHVTGLKPINLIVGRNNSGKTTLLEAIFLMGGATHPAITLTLGQTRGQRSGRVSLDSVLRPLFPGLDPRERIVIEAQRLGEPGPRRLEIEALDVTSLGEAPESDVGTGTAVASATEDFRIGGLRLRYAPASGPPITTTGIVDPNSGNMVVPGRPDLPGRERADFVRTTYLFARAFPTGRREAEELSSLLRLKHEQDVLEGVRILEPVVQRIEVLSDSAGAAVYVDVGLDSLIPLAVCGEGFVRLFSIIVELTASRGGVLLIDELDNGLHYSVMPKLWPLLDELIAKNQVQIIATTHNEELLFSALTAFRNKPNALGLFRIDRTDAGHRVVAYSREAMEGVLEAHFEVRG